VASTVARHGRALMVLFLLSGFAALTYQVLWVRELGLLFGSTAQAASMAIAIFFAGIASGGWYWGRRAARMRDSLRGFGLVEIGVAVTALGHFVLIDAYHALYPALYALVGHSPVLDTVAKAGVAAVVLLPPAFLMGGTLPLMGQHVVRNRDRLGTVGTRLYAVNTAGSAAGALAAGFVLPVALGFRGAYLLAVGLDLVVGLSAVALARRSGQGPARAASPTPRDNGGPASVAAPERAHASPTTPRPTPRPLDGLPPRLVWIVAAVSGFATLAVEVVWTRLFAQVLHNSAYTYALVLATFLVALTLGASLANVLARVRRVRVEVLLLALLLLSSAAAATSPWLFHTVTDGLAYVGSDLGWLGYLGAVAGVAAIVMLLPGTALGAVLPYLLRTLEADERAPGEAMGRLIAANTTGAILGSLTAGFVLLPTVGAWRALVWLGALYPLLIAGVAFRRWSPRRLATVGVATAAAVGLLVVDPQGLATVRTGGSGDVEVVELRQGPQAHVAVLERDREYSIRVNNYYTLGGTRALDAERDQTVVPLLTHPDPRSVFFLGMGTGITAGASMAFPVEQVVVCELIADVVAMAEDHFEPWTGGLFTDERATIHAEDGRTCLRRSDARYDVIISDLFTPWKAGTGNLYTYEHYRAARDRLHDGGQYVQWIPLYQVSERELAIIANTMDTVFDEVVMFRGDLFASRSIVALVGHTGPATIDPDHLVRAGRDLWNDHDRDDAWYEALALRMYVGNVTASGIFTDAPLNTDDRPLIEYLAPRTHREVRTGDARFVTGRERERLYDALLEAVPVDEDPALALLDDRQRGYVLAGRSYSAYRWHETNGRSEAAQEAYDDFVDRSPPGSVNALSPSRMLLPRPRPTLSSSEAAGSRPHGR
jgi:spermidine synthase